MTLLIKFIRTIKFVESLGGKVNCVCASCEALILQAISGRVLGQTQHIWTELSICRLSKGIEFNRNRSHWSGLQTFTEAGAVVQRCSGAEVQSCSGAEV